MSFPLTNSNQLTHSGGIHLLVLSRFPEAYLSTCIPLISGVLSDRVANIAKQILASLTLQFQ